ncbi:MAG: UDP-N-acetylmuramoyl-L-alanine--D-glutamate ligase, partial [Deltaproteobacteria bacterium]|nr:UDP-N-acetylmuramoyl-L-alanine--D-glutamate ligase [Deltaproteobacteria bacterium]
MHGVKAKRVPFSTTDVDKLCMDFDLSRVNLVGDHNKENILAAVLAVQSIFPGGKEKLQSALESFTGLKHRFEFVAEIDGVKFFDDSKGTNVGATARALMGCDAPVVLIAGGQHKGGSYAPLIPWVKEKVRHLVLIGEATPLIEADLAGKVAMTRSSSLDDAVARAFHLAKAGDLVLLSPACSSFDMFQNYAARGDAFVAAVKNLSGGDHART